MASPKNYSIYENAWDVTTVAVGDWTAPLSQTQRVAAATAAVVAICSHHGTGMPDGEGVYRFDPEIRIFLKQIMHCEIQFPKVCPRYKRLTRARIQRLNRLIRSQRDLLGTAGKLTPDYVAPEEKDPSILAEHKGVDKSKRL